MKKYLTKGAATAFLVAAASTNFAIADVDMAFGIGISGNYQFANKKIDSIAGFGLQDTKSGNFIIGGNAEFSIGLSEMFALSAGFFVDYSKYDQEFSSEAVKAMEKNLGVVVITNPDGTKQVINQGPINVHEPSNPLKDGNASAILKHYLFTPNNNALDFNRHLFLTLCGIKPEDSEVTERILDNDTIWSGLSAVPSQARDQIMNMIAHSQNILGVNNQVADQLISSFAANATILKSLVSRLVRMDDIDINHALIQLTPEHKTQLQNMLNEVERKKNKLSVYELNGLDHNVSVIPDLLRQRNTSLAYTPNNVISALTDMERAINAQPSIGNIAELTRLIALAKLQTGNELVATLNNLQTQINQEQNAAHKQTMLNYFNAAKNALGVVSTGDEKSSGSTISDAKLQLRDVRIGFAPAINFMISATDDVSFVIKFGPNVVYHMLKGIASAKVGTDSQSAEFKADYFSLDPQIGVGVQYKLPGDVAVLKLSVNYQTNNLIKFCGDKLKTTKGGTEEKDTKNLSSLFAKDSELEFGSVSHMLGVTLGVNFLL